MNAKPVEPISRRKFFRRAGTAAAGAATLATVASTASPASAQTPEYPPAFPADVAPGLVGRIEAIDGAHILINVGTNMPVGPQVPLLINDETLVIRDNEIAQVASFAVGDSIVAEGASMSSPFVVTGLMPLYNAITEDVVSVAEGQIVTARGVIHAVPSTTYEGPSGQPLANFDEFSVGLGTRVTALVRRGSSDAVWFAQKLAHA